jgi:glycosyltransferase involved in cell wall biosynthesis
MLAVVASEVSVVVPVRNGEPFVRACLENVLAQTRPPCEVIFVDDGSQDGTLALLRALGAREPRVNVLSQTPAGPAAARNTGIRAITGKYVAFLDVDDAWPLGMLEQACECFEQHPEASVVAGLVQICWTGLAPPEGSALRKPHRRVNLGAHTFRADVFTRFGLFDATLTYGEDIEYLSRLHQARVHIHRVDEVTLYYHQHGGNMTTGRGVHELGLFQALSRSLSRGRDHSKWDQ